TSRPLSTRLQSDLSGRWLRRWESRAHDKGNHRFDPGWLHSKLPCKTGILAVAHPIFVGHGRVDDLVLAGEDAIAIARVHLPSPEVRVSHPLVGRKAKYVP